jgi:hypothetical protein
LALVLEDVVSMTKHFFYPNWTGIAVRPGTFFEEDPEYCEVYLNNPETGMSAKIRIPRSELHHYRKGSVFTLVKVGDWDAEAMSPEEV